MKFLISGVAGFIASRTALFLLEQGHEVVGIDNLNDYYDQRLKLHRLTTLGRFASADPERLSILERSVRADKEVVPHIDIDTPRFSFRNLDIENKRDVLTLFEEHSFDAVLNLAARAGVRYSMENPDIYMMTNAMGTLHILDGMKNTGVKKMVLASTSSLYAGQEMPFTEDLAVNTPISPYAASKKAAEALCYSYRHLYDLDISVCRYFTVFGPMGRPDMSPFRFIRWIAEGEPLVLFGDGSQSRDFTHVDDIARGTIAALQPVGYEVFNLGGGNNPISLKQFIAWVEEMLGKKAKIDRKPFHKADVMETWADISKAERMLGWKPEEGIHEGVQQCVDWYLENRDWLSKVRV
ncbi:GDP-mannose 4,6-dehydratase [Puniceicoccus vermicola]|uniref:GDP-mannose 4,6-dehydratase n=1 Tax=Puniceicoccus vermicola TaxID=388746 RepID=A0A7X1AW65_9BACT|nr:GDP-mannose 4,6-dehydratase [Puniceicoccus vermicola]MBC2601096.1 GDP-mannose 4,6-dehydratase [Puniceicoccus vermicola]